MAESTTDSTRRAASLALSAHLRLCTPCRGRYNRFETHRLCEEGRQLYATFREAWTLTDDTSQEAPCPAT